MRRDSKEIKRIIESGSPKEKAVLVIRDSYLQQTGKPLLSELEMKGIYDSLAKDNAGATKFNKYIKIADTLASQRFRIYGLLQHSYNLARRIEIDCTEWECMERAVETFDRLLLMFKGTEDEQRIHNLIKNEAQKYPLWDIDIVDGKITIGDTRFRKTLNAHVKILCDLLKITKAWVIPTVQYIKKNKAEAFVPDDMEDIIEGIQSDLAHSETYSRTHYLKLKAEGSPEAEFYEKYAVYPAYEEIVPNITSMQRGFKYYGIKDDSDKYKDL